MWQKRKEGEKFSPESEVLKRTFFFRVEVVDEKQPKKFLKPIKWCSSQIDLELQFVRDGEKRGKQESKHEHLLFKSTWFLIQMNGRTWKGIPIQREKQGRTIREQESPKEERDYSGEKEHIHPFNLNENSHHRVITNMTTWSSIESLFPFLLTDFSLPFLSLLSVLSFLSLLCWKHIH